MGNNDSNNHNINRRKNRKKGMNRDERAMQIRFRLFMTFLVIVILVMVGSIIRFSTISSRRNRNGGASTGTASESVSSVAASSGIEDQSVVVEPVTANDPQAVLQATKPDIDPADWEYILVNNWSTLDESYVPDVTEIENVTIDTRIYDALEQFVEDCRATGLDVVISSGYRSYETQEDLMENDVAAYGQEEALKTLAQPGSSEHQTGLATDLTDVYYDYKDESIENTETYQWLLANCQDYGFILRYPKGKESITEIDYEPWHFRYVGVEAASFIMENNLTLEEFLALYE